MFEELKVLFISVNKKLTKSAKAKPVTAAPSSHPASSGFLNLKPDSPEKLALT
jgi:hypothetical protein